MVLRKFCLLAGCVMIVAPASMTYGSELTPGPGVFEFEDEQGFAEDPMRVFYHAPEDLDADTPVWFVMHGMLRNADEYRDNWNEHALEYGALVLAPEFSEEAYPGSRGYNQGNMYDSEGELRPERYWSFSVIDRLFEYVRAELDVAAEEYFIFGHSAGSQFVHRMVLFRPEANVAMAVTANAGWYTLPDPDISFPYGVGGTAVDTDILAGALEQPMVVLLGDQDNDPEHPHLRTSDGAMEQGEHRFARGQYFYEQGKEQAEALGAAFGWSLDIVEGVAHNNAEMAGAAAQLMHEAASSME